MKIAISRDQSGSTAIIFAMIILVVGIAGGLALDYSNLANKTWEIQNVGDAAILAIAHDDQSGSSTASRNQLADGFIASNGSAFHMARSGDVTLDGNSGELCLRISASVATTFAGLLGVPTLDVGTTSCAQVDAGDQNFEIALVVDVSSSMIEMGRFAPMQQAVSSFITAFSNDSKLRDKTEISLVPFSSRVNIGVDHAGWLTSYHGGPSVPARWTSPTSVYKSSTYNTLTWVQGSTTGYTNGTNTYWLGCIEPRSDVDVILSGAVSAASKSDATPSMLPFLAMDNNTGSGKSFCPPPIVPLSNNFNLLKSAGASLTSEGSTRLDAGLVAGWYTLSPNWAGLWGAPTSPRPAGGNVVKAVVFMTDGEMNTQRGQSTKHLDWLCQYDQSPSCNSSAVADMLEICTSMKAQGIDIFTVSYGEDADTANLQTCANDAEHFYTASASGTATDSIVTVYEKIAAAVKVSRLRLTQ